MTLPFSLPKRRRLYLMRHGDVAYFDHQGRPVDPLSVSLTAAGIRQAQAAGSAFDAANVRFDKVWTSGLKRTLETAQYVLDAVEQALTVAQIPALREIEGGRLADIPAHEREAAFLGLFDHKTNLNAKFLGGERLADCISRVLPAFQLLLDEEWSCGLLVLHGGVNRIILSHLLGQDFLPSLQQEPACINIIDLDTEHQALIRGMNICPYSSLLHDRRTTTMEELYHTYTAHLTKASK